MSKKANPAIVGGFVVGATILLVVGVVLFGSGKLFRPALGYVAYFEGSVKGLRIGAPVNFRGVRIGSVTDITVLVNSETGDIAVPVYFELEPHRVTRATDEGYENQKVAYERMQAMVDKGLRAHLETESFVTGQLAIELEFHPDKPAKYVSPDKTVVEFPTVPSSMQELTSTVQDLPIAEMFESLNRTIQNLEQLTVAFESAGTVQSLDQAVTDLRGLIQSVNAQVEPVADAVIQTMSETQKLVQSINGQVEPVATELLTSLADTQATLQQAERTLAGMEGIADGKSRLGHDVSQALQELTAAARALRQTAEFLQRHPESLIHGRSAGKGQ